MPASSTDPPLAGIRVLELGQDVEAAPYCGRLLAEFGASVCRVEVSEGDPARRTPPLIEQPGEPAISLLYLYLNHGKSIVTVDPATAGAVEQLLALAAESDVVVENLDPDALRQLGIEWNALHAANRRLILASISPFGRSGPYRKFNGSDIVCEALGGLSYIFGYHDREPLTHPNAQAQYRAGTYAASAILAALLNLDDDGEWIDLSITECVAAGLREVVPMYTFMGAVRSRSADPTGGFGHVVACADGYVIPTVWGASDFSTIARFLESPALDDPRFATSDGRERYGPELAALLGHSLARWPKLEFFHRAHEWGLGAGVVLSPREVTESEQLDSRDFFRAINVGASDELPAPRGPFVL